jgi:hypothetical protein
MDTNKTTAARLVDTYTRARIDEIRARMGNGGERAIASALARIEAVKAEAGDEWDGVWQLGDVQVDRAMC